MHHPRRVGGLFGKAGSVAVAAAAAALLAACSGPGSSAPDTSAAAAPESVSTSIGSAPVALTLYDGQGLQNQRRSFGSSIFLATLPISRLLP